MKKKFASVLFGIAFAFALAIPTFAAQGTTVCKTDDAVLERGDAVSFTVSASESITDSVLAINLWEKGKETESYAWDSEVFELVSGEWLVLDSSDSKLLLQDTDLEKGAAVFMSKEDVTVKEDLFRLTLRVKSDAPFGTYSVAPAIQFEGGEQLELRQAAQVQVSHVCQGEEYLFDDTHHWQQCSVEGCTEEIVKVPHAYTDDCDEVCDCGKMREVTHAYESASDEENHWQECSLCHKTKDTQAHSFQSAWDEENHFQECTLCHKKIEIEKHTYSADCDPECDACTFTRTPTAEHHYKADCATLCTACHDVRTDTPDHIYDSADDADCNLCGEVRKTYIPGDVDGSGEVTDRDAVYLLYHTFLSETYPVNQDCDFNGDGEVTDKDAVYLLYYTFLPDSYPLS